LVDVPPGTPAGTYTITYEICEELNPTNCAQNTVTVAVDAAPIIAADDNVAGVNGSDGANGVVNVLDGDTLNGTPATLDDVDITVVTPATPANPGNPVPVLDPATGLVDVPAGTPAGIYTIEYQICEELNPTNCDTATATIEVDAAPIFADPDSVTDINGADGATGVANVLDGDTLNGAPATLDGVDITVVTPATPLNPGDPVPVLDPATGLVDVPAGTPAGTYTITYEICEELNPTNCSQNTVTVTVDAAPIVADPDAANGVNGTTGADGVVDVLEGDTLNGAPATLDVVDITVVTPATPANPGDPAPVLDPVTGLVDVPPGTPAGTYTITYEICEELNPTNCAQNTITIEVQPPEITAGDDTPPAVNGADGGDDIINAFDNDTLNGAPVDPGDVTASITSPATPVTPGAPVPVMDTETGLVDVPAGTPAGTYTIEYEICEDLNPTNCATGTVTVEVEAPEIVANDDEAEPVRGGIGNPEAINVLANDTLNEDPIDPDDVTLSVTSGPGDPGIVLDPATGNVSVGPDVPPGTYVIEYEVCEVLNPTNCATSSVTIVVDPAISSVEGTVFLDADGDRELSGNDEPRAGWIVEILRNGELIATTFTDADGNYRFDDLLSGQGYSIRFRNPENNVVYGILEDIELESNTVVIDQDLPIDPSGVVYNSITRAPVAGAVASLLGPNGMELPDVCFLDPSQQAQTTGASGEYRFDIVPGAAAQCPTGETQYTIAITPPSGFSFVSTVLLPQPDAFDPTGQASPVRISPTATAPTEAEPTYYLEFLLETGDPDVIFNHIPIDPFISRDPLIVTKTSTKRNVSTGDLVPYEITVRNAEGAQRAGVTVVDLLPSGFKYVVGSASVNGVPNEPEATNSNRQLEWRNQTIPGNATVTYNLVLTVGAGVTEGTKVNTGFGLDGPTGAAISNRGSAAVQIVPSSAFDCSELIGKVYEDANRNGYQDEGEPGVPGVRLATVNGLLVTTDEFGRFHIACAAVPDARIGSNFVLKLDPRTLPLGWEPTTDNPRSIRLTRGKMGELNFGVAPQELEDAKTRDANEGGEE
jgi:uncharacterized repeat protein (TIGR01451 family)